ncbi:hypothetical protein J6590_001918 [Homalodisca vitripennis]|nr:hypothetical protein J6590_001918 [Homalodisca vitripennis]
MEERPFVNNQLIQGQVARVLSPTPALSVFAYQPIKGSGAEEVKETAGELIQDVRDQSKSQGLLPRNACSEVGLSCKGVRVMDTIAVAKKTCVNTFTPVLDHCANRQDVIEIKHTYLHSNRLVTFCTVICGICTRKYLSLPDELNYMCRVTTFTKSCGLRRYLNDILVDVIHLIVRRPALQWGYSYWGLIVLDWLCINDSSKFQPGTSIRSRDIPFSYRLRCQTPQSDVQLQRTCDLERSCPCGSESSCKTIMKLRVQNFKPKAKYFFEIFC